MLTSKYAISWLISYITGVTTNSSVVLSPSVILPSRLSTFMFLLLLVLFWTHNQFSFKRQYSQWDRLFFGQRWGTLAEQE